jgi:pimeloyl-ACP methyl ester carboxylesterase
MNKNVWLIMVSGLLFWGCSRKVSAFVKSFSPAIHKERVNYSDGKAGLYYHRKGNHQKEKTALFIVGGSGHSSSVYTLANFAKGLRPVNADLFILQKRHVKNRETGMRKARKDFIRDYYFDQMVADQEYFIKKISGDEKYKKVIVLGVSEGATIAAKVAADIPAVNYLAIVAGGGMMQCDEFKLLYPNQLQNLNLLYAAIKNNPETLDTMAMGYTYKYWSNILFTDPMKYLLPLDIPILVANGANDRSTAVESARYIDSIFKTRHKSNLTYVEYKKCDHSLIDEAGKSHLPEFFKILAAATK